MYDEAKARYERINKHIENAVPSLGSAYKIGPAYFRKLVHFQDATTCWEAFWSCHLLVLLREYRRGLPDANSELEKLQSVYNNITDDSPADNNTDENKSN